MTISTRLRRAVIATAGAAAIVAGATAAVASGPGTANPGTDAPDKAAISSIFPAGSELQFVAVAPCRIVDTRLAGGAISGGSRVFDATLTDYSGQGGKSGSCGVPTSGVAAVQLNLGAIWKAGGNSQFSGWATGSPEPLASLVNYTKAGPIANMVTLPVNASGQFTLKTPGTAHAFVDVAGFYVKPLYASVSSAGTLYGASSGVTSVARTGTGMYTVTFDRDVTQCSATTASITWASNLDVSPEVGVGGPNTVTVGIANPANAMTDGYFYIHLTC